MILVVEDDKGLNNLIQKNLQALGYSTDGVFSGREAVTKVMTGDYSLMILDFKLQDMSGKQVVEELDSEGYKIPFVVVTGFGDERVAVEMMKLGARDYIIKDESLIEILPYRIKKTFKEISHENIVASVDMVLEESELQLKSVLAASPTGIGLIKNRVFSWVSDMVVEMTGYAEGELLGESVRMFYENDEEYDRVGHALYDHIQEKGKGDADTQWRRRDGRIIDVYVQVASLNPDNIDAGIIFSALDVTERKRIEDIIRVVSRGAESLFGKQFFDSMVLSLVKTLEVDYAFIAELTGEKHDSVMTMSLCVKGEIAENFEYALAGTPCEKVVGRYVCSYPSGVYGSFPRDHMLKEMKIEGYVGMPLFSSTGESLGIMVVMNCSPLSNVEFTESIMQVFAARAGAELERISYEQELLESKKDWEEVFDSVTDMITIHDADFNIIRANKAAAELLKLPLMEDLKVKCFKYYHGGECPLAGCPSCDCMNTAKPATFEVFEPFLKKHIEIRAMPRFDMDNKLIGLIHVVRDLTESKASEDREKSLGRIFDTSLNEIYIFSADSLKFIQVNQGARKNLDYSMDELLDMTPLDLKPDFNSDMFMQMIEPLRSGTKDMVNFTTVHLRKDGTLYPVDVHLQLSSFGNEKVFVAIIMDITQRKAADEMIQLQLKRIKALHSIDMAITSSLNLNVTLDIFLDQVMNLLGIDAAAVLLLNENSNILEYYVSSGFISGALKHTKLKLGESNAGKAALDRRIVSIANLPKDTDSFEPSKEFVNEKFISYFAIPLIAKGKVKGVLELFHRTLFEADEDWMDFLSTVAVQAAIAIDDSLLFEELQRSNVDLAMAYDATIEGWARALDLRDEETEGHSRRVTEITICLARELGIKDEELLHVKRGALLHDIGKMGIPDSILLKPGKLDDEEWKIMKQHPKFAHDLIYPIKYLRPAIVVPYSHHEKWDGTGYPNGLKGDEIPLAARIFAVVDVWDALASDRPYRKAWPKDKITDFIRSQAGIHFDPGIVEVFLSWACVDFD